MKTTPISQLAKVLLLFLLGVLTTAQNEDNVIGAEEDSVFLWSSTGGGWRAMVACMGFANLFGRAGLLPLIDGSTPLPTKTKFFDAVSTTSGASWFSTQFFFSQNFYTKTMTYESAMDASSLSTLISDWMTAYNALSQEVEAGNYDCVLPSDLPRWKNSEFDKMFQLCDAMMHNGNQWAAFVTSMLNNSAISAYDDPQYASLPATPNNRIPLLQDANIKLLTHTTLVPQTRTFQSHLLGLVDEDYVSNLGPSQNTTLKWAGVLPVTYSVDSDQDPSAGVYTIGGGDTLQVHQDKVPRIFHKDDYEDYGLYPLKDTDTYLIDVGGSASSLGDFNTAFFGGNTLTTQAASISSAAAGGLSPSAPSVFAQLTEQQKYTHRGDWVDEAAIDIAIQALYDSDVVKGTAVCSQWPQLPCGDTDGRFIDGAYSDNPALIDNIAHYQNSNGANLTKTLKIVLTNTNQNPTTRSEAVADAMQFVKYWKNDENIDKEPGYGYLWVTLAPFGSPQIFQEELTVDDYINATSTEIEGTNFTTRILKGTTIDNPVWGTKAGQQVEILLISTNSFIPIMIVGTSEATEYAEPLNDMAVSLATNEILLERVQSFFFDSNEDNDEDDSTVSKGGDGEESEEEMLVDEITPEPEPESKAALMTTKVLWGSAMTMKLATMGTMTFILLL